MIVSFGSFAIAGSIGTPAEFATPKAWSKRCRSRRIVGEPKLSTIAIVWPAPVIPAAWSGARLYAASSCAGE